MPQYDFGTIDPAATSGTALAALLGSWRDALNSTHGGSGTRPTYAINGTIWNKTISGTVVQITFFDGTDDIALFTIDRGANTVDVTYKNGTFTGTVKSAQNFESTTTTLALGTSAAGNLYLRPNGVASTTGQWQLKSTGAFYVATGLLLMKGNGTGVIDPTIADTDGVSIDTATASTVMQRASNPALTLKRLTSTGAIANFYYGTALVGSISVTGAATAYNTSSDYRLKYDIVPLVDDFTVSADEFSELPDALRRVLAYDPKSFRMYTDETKSLFHGFIAHELQKIAPHAVTGVKDGTEDLGTASVLVPSETVPNVTQAEAIARGLIDWQSSETPGQTLTIPAKGYAVKTGIRSTATVDSQAEALAAGAVSWADGVATFSTPDQIIYDVTEAQAVASGYSQWVMTTPGSTIAPAPAVGTAKTPEQVIKLDNITQAEATSRGALSWVKTSTRIVPQQVDHSKLVPDLTAAIIELTLEVIKLKAEINALKS